MYLIENLDKIHDSESIPRIYNNNNQSKVVVYVFDSPTLLQYKQNWLGRLQSVS